jgi:hypothetical protein
MPPRPSASCLPRRSDEVTVVLRGLAYSVLVIAFGLGVWGSASGKRALRIVGRLLVGIGVVDLVAPPFVPMHLRGLQRFNAAIISTMIILAECGVLASNEGSCPLTSFAAQFTTERADNFDIYLPNWLARHNKLIFGTLFIVNELFVLWCWAK